MATELLPPDKKDRSWLVRSLKRRGPTAAALFVGRLAAAACLFATNLVLARQLGPVEFGRYALVVSILTFTSLFLDVGYFSSGARLLTGMDRRGSDARGLVAILVGVTALVSLPYVLVIVGVSYFTDRIFDEGTGALIRSTLAYAPAMLLPLMVEQVLKGLQHNYALAFWTVGSRFGFAAAVAIWMWNGELSALRATSAYLASMLVATLLLLPVVRPTLKGWKRHLSTLSAEHRRFGRPLYLGRLANQATYRTDTLILGAFRDTSAVGHYTLAMSFGNLIAFYSQALATMDFRRLAQEARIPAALMHSNLVGIAMTALLVIGAGELAVAFYLGSAYDLLALLVPLCVVAVGLQGAYQPYNSWLLAHGYGVELRSFLIVVAVVNLSANLILIPLIGAVGAALASGVGMGTYLLLSSRTVARLVSEAG